jgi:alpha-L-fucosidase 2
MKRTKHLFLFMAIILKLMSVKANATDLKLWYDRPASVWNQALPIGNGRLGAMYFGDPSSDKLQLNEGTFWSGSPSRNDNNSAKGVLQTLRNLIFNGQYSNVENLINKSVTATTNHGSMYQTVGYLNLQFANQADYSNYRRELDLSRAVQTATYEADGVTYKREVFASQPDQVIVMRLSASEGGKISFTASMSGALAKASRATSDSTLEMTGLSSDHEGVTGKVYFDARTQFQLKGGTKKISSNSIVVTGADEVVIFISMATNFTNYHALTTSQITKCAGFMNAAVKKPYDMILTDHIAAYQNYFNRVSLDLGTSVYANFPTDTRISNFSSCYDPQLVTMLYQFGRYLLISCSQPGGQPATLQGLWNDSSSPVWDSKYTININTEMNYWPAEKCNLSEMHQPLIQMLKELAVTGQQTAQNMYGCRGWVCHHNTDIWRISGVVDCANSGMWPMGSAWLSQHLWEKYLYTGDKVYLDSVYPILKSACEFYRDFLVVDPKTKYLEVCPSLSPEHTPYAYSPTSVNTGVTMDNQLLFDLFSKTMKAASILKVDSAEMATFKSALDSLSPMRIGKYGQLQEWKDDWDDPNDNHRHVSHLYGLFPSSQISPYNSPKLASAARTSLVERGDASTGWSMGWKINLWARLLDGNHAYKLITDQLTLVDPVNSGDNGGTYPNFFDAHPPFQIDGNFGCTSGITEMLMQSYDGSIFLMPAMPDAWKTEGSINGLKAYGGFEVSYTWKDGEVQTATIKSALGGNCRLRLPNTMVLSNGTMKVATGTNPNEYFATPTPRTPIISTSANVSNFVLPSTYLYDFDTQVGGTYTLVNKKLVLEKAVVEDSASNKIFLKLTQPVVTANSTKGFTVKVDGKIVDIKNVAKGASANEIVLTLSDILTKSQSVTLTYNDGDILSDCDIPLTAFTNVTVDNMLTGSAPRLLSAETSIDGKMMYLTFNKKMDLATDLTMMTLKSTYSGKTTAISLGKNSFATVGDSTCIAIVLSQPVYREYTLTLSSTVSSFKSHDGGLLANQSLFAVINLSKGLPVTMSSIALSTDGVTITMTFNKRLAMSYDMTKQFSVSVDGMVTALAVISVSGSTILITMPTKLRYGRDIKVSYTPGDVKALDGGELDTFSDQTVTVSVPSAVKIPGKIETESYTDMYGVQTETASDIGGTKDVCYIDDGDWTEYIVNNNSSATAFILSLRMASPYGNGLVDVKLDDKKMVELAISNTGGWQTYKTFNANITIPAGIHYITLVYTKAGVNINYLELTSNTSDINVQKMEEDNVNVYSLSGIQLKKKVSRGSWSQGLSHGVYIVNDKKSVK